ncbi:hypothetical protein JANAI62_04310 [Jannaschia pagri]|uniref:Uncharacterized protein n=2 Tax=Jannaschia pagri TaxID=2829797 RepID=A0ABQ4NHA1_9RHOB|nr:DUF6476 family protein [Jannaschia sp. AI_61]GIT90086.1 hypothetical protein JANAI61_05440 [Jannaschia sp. AI_61]GIT93808.1 hypothetical protein JANAI62_04310 [Jannaschia sp. AI_62]
MDEIPEPANLRFLRRLVTVLTAVMIIGLVTVIGLLVQRLRLPSVPVPEALALPDGTEIHAVTQGPGWWAVVTGDGRILLYDGAGTFHQEIVVTLPQTAEE